MKCSHRCVYLIRPLGGQTSSGDKKTSRASHPLRLQTCGHAGRVHQRREAAVLRFKCQQDSFEGVCQRELCPIFPQRPDSRYLICLCCKYCERKVSWFFSVTFLSVISRKINQTRHICSSRKKKKKSFASIIFTQVCFPVGFGAGGE